MDAELLDRIRARFDDALDYLSDKGREERIGGIKWAQMMIEQELRVVRGSQAREGRDMSGCTATLTTATVTDEVRATLEYRNALPVFQVPKGATVQRQGNRLVRVTLHTLTCVEPVGHDGQHASNPDEYGNETNWTDYTPGATPHRDPCPTCGDEKATISSDDGHFYPCPSCSGTGQREFHAPDTKPPTWGKTKCPDCDGSGLEFERGRPGTLEREAMSDCPSCGGSGTATLPCEINSCTLLKGHEGKHRLLAGTAPSGCPWCGESGHGNALLVRTAGTPGTDAQRHEMECPVADPSAPSRSVVQPEPEPEPRITIHFAEVRAAMEADGVDPDTFRHEPYTRMLVAAKRAEARLTRAKE